MGYDGDSVGVVEAWSIIQNTCQNYFEPNSTFIITVQRY